MKQTTLEAIRNYFNSLVGEGKKFSAKNEFARYLGMETLSLQSKFYNFLKGKGDVSSSSLLDWTDRLGISFSLPNEEIPTKEVCFIKTNITEAGQNADAPEADDYIAAPLVGEVGAGPGYLPQEEIRSWFLAYKYHPAVRSRRNLIAVEIGEKSISMQPTLNPGDIVLVDRDDKKISRQGGQIMLVLDPIDGAGMIKRVYVEDLHNGDFSITFCSDNVANFKPMVYSLKKDFLGDFDRAIVGHVVWRWSEMHD